MLQLERSLPCLLFVSGVINVLVIKWADRQESKGIDSLSRRFYHPFVQVAVMFIGEMLCFLIFKAVFLCLQRKRDGSEETNILTAGGREFSPKIFIIPAICDVIATTMLLMGIYLTSASSFQILRCTLLIFLNIINGNYNNLALTKQQWFGIFVIALGTIFIPLNDYLNFNYDENNLVDVNGVLTGNQLIVCAQVFQAVHIVYEERYVKTLNVPPLQAVGWEGIFGFIIVVLLLIPINFFKASTPFNNNANQLIEDFPDAIIQMSNNYILIISHLIFIVTILIYNFAAIYLSKCLSSSNRIAIDTVRIIPIWLLSLLFGWQIFSYLQLIGVIIIFIGIFIYQNIVFVQLYCAILGNYLRRRNGETDDEEVISQPADAV